MSIMKSKYLEEEEYKHTYVIIPKSCNILEIINKDWYFTKKRKYLLGISKNVLECYAFLNRFYFPILKSSNVLDIKMKNFWCTKNI